MSNGRCELCGEMMPRGEEMFKHHGFRGPCPKPPSMKIESTPERLGAMAGASAGAVAGAYEKKIDALVTENARLRDALEFADVAIAHALHLGYCGEGSTKGLMHDALDRVKAALESK